MRSKHQRLPGRDSQPFLTDAGIETHMQYTRGYELPHFCLFDLMKDPKAIADLRNYHERIIGVALEYKVGCILDGVHYRSSSDWGKLLGYSEQGLADVVIQGIEFYQDLAREFETEDCQMPVSGVIGPRGDAYKVGRLMTATEAEDYHATQIATMKTAGAEMITALTFNHVDEAVGAVLAAQKLDIPIVISFSVGADGKLKTGPELGDALLAVDAATNKGPSYYMINCAHPIDFAPAFDKAGAWTERLGGLRPNASSLDHGMLCQLGHLEAGDPDELAGQMADMAKRFPHINVWGGCCGTDYKHIAKIAAAVLPH